MKDFRKCRKIIKSIRSREISGFIYFLNLNGMLFSGKMY